MNYHHIHSPGNKMEEKIEQNKMYTFSLIQERLKEVLQAEIKGH